MSRRGASPAAAATASLARPSGGTRLLMMMTWRRKQPGSSTGPSGRSRCAPCPNFLRAHFGTDRTHTLRCHEHAYSVSQYALHWRQTSEAVRHSKECPSSDMLVLVMMCSLTQPGSSIGPSGRSRRASCQAAPRAQPILHLLGCQA